MLKSVSPKLPMRNKIETKNFYINLLNFEEINDYGDYLLLKKDDVEIHFFEFKELNPTENYGMIYLRVSHIEKLYKTFVECGIPIHPNGNLETKHWQQKEFSILDPDSNLLTFGENV